jgi:hypothetical protein
MESQAPRELDPVMQPTLVNLQLLPSGVLDMITEKVRGGSPQSFRALERTCTELRDSARRCAQTLIIEHSNQGESDSRLHGTTEETNSRVQGTAEECEVSDSMGKRLAFAQILARSFPERSACALCWGGWLLLDGLTGRI